MVRQMIDKFNEYKFVSSGSAMPTGDKQNPIAVKKVALRELPNETRNIITQLPGNSPPSKDSQAVSNATVKVYGIKRQQPDCPASPSSLHLPANSSANGHLVYVRRKLDTEPGKISSCGNTDGAGSLEPRKSSNGVANEAKLLREQLQGSSSFQTIAPVPVASSTVSSQGTSPPATLGKSMAGLVSPEPKDSIVTTTMPGQVDSQQAAASPNYWKERFFQLQTFLKNCDQSGQEDYIRMLRSLSAVGRSQHAVELEKRAIHLLLEEVKELHRMRVLNVLGKALPNDHGSGSPSISSTSPIVDFMKAEMTAFENPKYPWLNHG
ncbi:hypothetical protein J5N97_023666 [Dioscorea zingiberensis]|uniref:Uncharacterized protein n=1 Tax=Dioscorea zingiberensis TaxID=325984 RepID=A0A9D5C635_9LILI|nr:hypothetical protein J5N97_023666 [Dioscorea zingiberensis]